jgi:integrase
MVRTKKLSQGDTLTMEEAHRLVAQTRDPYKPLVWLLIMCGLRPQEVCGLRVEHIDFARRTLHAVETVNFVPAFDDQPATTHRGPTKTEAGDRFLPISQELADDLAAMLARRAERRGSAVRRSEPLFESIKGGKPLIVDDLRRRVILPALKSAGLSTKIRTYDTRHSHALLLLEDGAQILEVAQRVRFPPAPRAGPSRPRQPPRTGGPRNLRSAEAVRGHRGRARCHRWTASNLAPSVPGVA